MVEVWACGRCHAFGKNVGAANRVCLVAEISQHLKTKTKRGREKGTPLPLSLSLPLAMFYARVLI
jgi:hypothetical protein